MSNTAVITGSGQATIDGSTTNLSFTGQYPFDQNKAPILYQTITDTAALLGLGGVTKVLALILKVLPVVGGTGIGHVYLGLDNANPPAQMMDDIPEGLGVVRFPRFTVQPAAIYAVCPAGTSCLVIYQVIAAA